MVDGANAYPPYNGAFVGRISKAPSDKTSE